MSFVKRGTDVTPSESRNFSLNFSDLPFGLHPLPNHMFNSFLVLNYPFFFIVAYNLFVYFHFTRTIPVNGCKDSEFDSAEVQ